MRTLDTASPCVTLAAIGAALLAPPLAASETAGPSAPAAARAAPAVQDARPRSLCFYLIDTCRGDRVSFDGYGRPTTPFLEWLAERSVVFEACYSQAPWTKPSMASMLSSRYPSEHGLYRMDHRLPDAALTWPEVLQAHGLFTAGFSANIVMGGTLSNFAQGFEHFVESTEINSGDAIRFASGSARKLNDRALAWLEGDTPWPMLLYMHSVDPHEEYEPEPRYLERFADADAHGRYREMWKTLQANRPPIPGLFVTQDDFDATQLDSSAFVAHGSDLYDADIAANDDQLKRLWDALQEDGWGDDMAFVVTSDHGEEFFDHGGTSHGYSLYGEMTRVPLMIYAPGLLPGGTRVDTPVRSIDIYPTLCELLDIEPPDGLRGESLLPLARGEQPGAARSVFSQHREDPVLRLLGEGSGVMVSLRRGRWSYIFNEVIAQRLPKPRHELYDLSADPHEQRNVADERPELVARFAAEVQEFLAAHQPPSVTRRAADMDPAVLEQLRALGYVGAEAPGRPDIWDALRSADPGQIARALDAGADPDALEPEAGISPLAIAAMHDNVRLAELLLEHGADVNVRGIDGGTPLHAAAFLGRAEMLALLLERGADPGARSLSGDTPLGSTEVPWNVTEFIIKLVEVPAEREQVEEGRALCARILRGLQADADDPTARLFAAIDSGDTQRLQACLAEGVDIDAQEARLGWTPLSKAIFVGQAPVARWLLEHGADAAARSRDQATPLHTAAGVGAPALVELLLAHGADVDARDGRGATPLHAAAFLGRAAAVDALLDAGADAALRDADGQTPLEATRVDWQTTALVLQMLGLDADRTELEQGRAAVAERLDA